MRPREALRKYLDGELDFAKMWAYACLSPECLFGMELVEHYDRWANSMRKGRALPEEFEMDLRERLKALDNRSDW